MKYKVVLRISFFVMFAIICFAQCYSILTTFFSYPRIISIYDESPSLITILPALTICNNNRISLRKLVRRNETLEKIFAKRFPGWLKNGHIKQLVNTTKFNNVRDELARIYEAHDNYYIKQTKNISLDEWFDYRPDLDQFIEWFGCARTWKDSIDCGNLTRIESISDRLCTTLLHKGAMTYDVHNRPELFNTTSERSSTLNYFDAKEVIKLVLNFEPEDYGDIKRQIGARITFHDNNYVASLGDLNYFVTRGYRYDFSINRKDVKLTGPPYDNCLDHDTYNLEKFKTRIEPRLPLKATTCFQNCVVRNVINFSDCWPATVPYFRNDSLDPELKLTPCVWFKRSNLTSMFQELMRVDAFKSRQNAHNDQISLSANSSARPMNDSLGDYSSAAYSMPRRVLGEKMRKYRKILRFCRSQCILSCRLTQYSVSVTRSAWPTDVKMLFDTTGKANSRRHCCALIAIKFTHFHYNIHEYRPKYEASNTVGDIGGLLAFWLGLSIVSIYHVFQKLITFCTRHSLNKIHQLES